MSSLCPFSIFVGCEHWSVRWSACASRGSLMTFFGVDLKSGIFIDVFFCNGGAVRLVGCYWTWLADATALLICSPRGFLEEIFYFSDCQLSNNGGSCYRLKWCAERKWEGGLVIAVTSIWLQLSTEWASSLPETHMVSGLGLKEQHNLHAAPSSGWPSPEAQLASLGFHEPNYWW